jgi:hypothetical protein
LEEHSINLRSNRQYWSFRMSLEENASNQMFSLNIFKLKQFFLHEAEICIENDYDQPIREHELIPVLGAITSLQKVSLQLLHQVEAIHTQPISFAELQFLNITGVTEEITKLGFFIETPKLKHIKLNLLDITEDSENLTWESSMFLANNLTKGVERVEIYNVSKMLLFRFISNSVILNSIQIDSDENLMSFLVERLDKIKSLTIYNSYDIDFNNWLLDGLKKLKTLDMDTHFLQSINSEIIMPSILEITIDNTRFSRNQMMESYPDNVIQFPNLI